MEGKGTDVVVEGREGRGTEGLDGGGMLVGHEDYAVPKCIFVVVGESC